MSRILLAAILAASFGAPAAASQQLRLLVEQELPRWGFDNVDVDRLTTGQVAQLHHLFYSSRTHSDRRALIESVLRGSFTMPELPPVNFTEY